MNWLFWIPFGLFAVAGLVSLGIGWSKSNECGHGTPCEMGANLLKASNFFFIFATAILGWAIHQSDLSPTCEVSRALLILSVFLFVIASILFGVGADRTDVCIDTCKTGMNWLIASNVLFLITGLIAVWHFSGNVIPKIPIPDFFQSKSASATPAVTTSSIPTPNWMTAQ